MENKDWKKFRTTSKIPMEFLHRDEFKKQYASKFGSKYTFPIVLLAHSGKLEILITTEELNGMKNVEELTHLISERHPQLTFM